MLHFGDFALRVRCPHADLPHICVGRSDARFRLLYARARRYQLRSGDINRALCLRQFFLIRSQRTGCRVGIGFRGVVLVFGNFAFVEQRLITRQIGLPQLGIRFTLLDIRLRKGEIRCARLVVGNLSALESSYGAGQLRIRTGCAAGHVLARPGNIDSRGSRIAFRERQSGLGLVHVGLIIARINPHQHLTGLHGLIVRNQNFCDAPVNLGSDRSDVPIHLRVVRRLAIVVVHKKSGRYREQHQPANHEQAPHLGTLQALWRLLKKDLLLRPRLDLRCIFESHLDLNAHSSPRVTSSKPFPFDRWSGLGRHAPD